MQHGQRTDNLTYDILQKQYEYLNIQELDLSEVQGLKGFCFDDNIAIEKNMTQTEKACILAEELGHYHTTSGDILNQNEVSNRKQEQRARFWAYNKLIGLSGIINGFEAGCQSRYELADFLGVTEEFLQSALDRYSAKYGRCIQIGDYIILFAPGLGVIKQYTE